MMTPSESSHSGLVRRLGKAVSGQPDQGFKSLTLRQNSKAGGYVLTFARTHFARAERVVA